MNFELKSALLSVALHNSYDFKLYLNGDSTYIHIQLPGLYRGLHLSTGVAGAGLYFATQSNGFPIHHPDALLLSTADFQLPTWSSSTGFDEAYQYVRACFAVLAQNLPDPSCEFGL